jgi:hypothetical protein
VVDDRRLAWSSRLTTRANSMTILAEDDNGLTGFVHTVFDDDDRWGSLIDNLHVVHSRQRTGVGTALLTYAANAVAERAVNTSIYLWVLSQNIAAQRFYRALGGTCVEKSTASPPGGVPTRLNGSPGKLRITWPDPATLLRAAARADSASMANGHNNVVGVGLVGEGWPRAVGSRCRTMGSVVHARAWCPFRRGGVRRLRVRLVLCPDRFAGLVRRLG